MSAKQGPHFTPVPGMVIEYLDGVDKVRSPIRYARHASYGWMVGFEGTTIAWAQVTVVWSYAGALLWERP